MSRLLFFLLACLPLAASAQFAPQWELLEGSPTHWYRYEDASFISPQVGWIVNGSGEVWATENGGDSWERRSISEVYLRSTAFPSANLGWAGVLFNNVRLYETRDGGTTMVDVTSRIEPAIGGGVCGLFALDETTAFGVGEWDGPAYFIKTTDGGTSWQSTDMSAYAQSLIDVRFTDANNGLVVGGTNGTRPDSRAVVLTTDDGGATWTERFRSSGIGTQAEWAWKISFPSPLVGYVSVEHSGGGELGKVLKTTDGGVTWTEIQINGGTSFQGVGFITPEVGWTSGRGMQMRTLDGGETWAEEPGIDGWVNRFEFFGDTLGYAMGKRIYKLDMPPPPPPVANEPTQEPLALAISAAPNPASGAVSFQIRAASRARLDIFDTLGRSVATIPVGIAQNQIRWNARGLPAGIYIARLASGGQSVSTRIVLR